jgi:phosphohistidine phosphatase
MEVDDAHALMISVAPDATGTGTRMVRGLRSDGGWSWSVELPMIWMLRHGDAEDSAENDDARRLTEKGERQAEAAGGALTGLGVSLDACLTSPKIRARDTARIVGRELGVEVDETEALRGGDFDPEQVAGQVRIQGRGPATVLLVGHEPDLSHAIDAATGTRVQLKKGGLAAIEGGTLIVLLGSGQLRAIASPR